MTRLRTAVLPVVLALAFVCIAAVSLRSAPETAYASVGTTLTGWAWSDTIGWISMSGSGYGVSLQSNGTLTGYAWSDNIGWIKFGGLSSFPSTGGNATLTSHRLQGWARACAGTSSGTCSTMTSRSDGWDGWISLSGSDYGPTLSSGSFDGFAWGSNVVGWVDFSLVKAICASGLDAGAYPSCTCPSGYVKSGTSCIAQCANGLDRTRYPACTCPSGQIQSGDLCVVPPAPSFVEDGSRTGHLQVTPSLLRRGGTAVVYWHVDNVESCTVTEDNPDINDSWTGASSGGVAKITSALYRTTTYTLSCTGLDSSTINESATVNLIPIFQEL